MAGVSKERLDGVESSLFLETDADLPVLVTRRRSHLELTHDASQLRGQVGGVVLMRNSKEPVLPLIVVGVVGVGGHCIRIVSGKEKCQLSHCLKYPCAKHSGVI